ncbi:TetR/AcrR family transcriptional regulator [Streptomyces sp. NBC_00820]|uniref:TetR/AcrR family transcriptional regulator n=1 Tax=Streptomyces sp. NBC_00820 TaxID=2975842 RepID=UPI002ED6B338|nr:TetR/AcrR family transcriptional regulator [Streptomyces sp. NBC_00820]
MTGRREEILDAALALADERGLEAVSMRALAERVGVTPMALYRHVADKAALLDAMVGRLLGALLPPEAGAGDTQGAGTGAGAKGTATDTATDTDTGTDAGTDAGRGRTWDQRLNALAYACREIAQRHPWAAHLLFSRPAVTADAARAVDIIYLALLEAGVPESEVPRLERLVTTFVIGFAASEAAGRFAPGALDPRGRRGRRGRLPESELPGHRRLAPWLDLPPDLTAEFEADLDDIRCLVEAVARRRH